MKERKNALNRKERKKETNKHRRVPGIRNKAYFPTAENSIPCFENVKLN
jgi:hypothetical protein